MPNASIDFYIAAFVARCNAMRDATCQMVHEPGVHGLVSFSDHAPTQLLVTDDHADEVLAALMPILRPGTIRVFAAAPRCTRTVASDRRWKAKPVTAMIRRDLLTLPEDPLPSGLMLRPVRRVADDPIDGVPLEDAVAAVRLANPSDDDAPDVLAEHLRSWPAATRLFAAVDVDGVVRATSGSGTFGSEATVFFVNTHPGWRRRGIGRAMTAAALHSAQKAGSSRACLDASDDAIPLYQRLGFENVAPATQFFHAS